MRILVISNLYPPYVVGGYEVECAGVVRHLRESGHEVRVLTSRAPGSRTAPDEHEVARDLPLTRPNVRRDSLRAPLFALSGVRTIRRELRRGPFDLVWSWNGAQIPQAALQIAATSGVPFAVRVCERWFGRLYLDDVFMRHLLPGETGARGVWARGMRAVNRVPTLRVDPHRPARAAICWNSETVRGLAPAPAPVEPVLTRVIHSAPSKGPAFATLDRRPGEDPLILFAGRLSEAKGLDVAIRAIALLVREHEVRARLLAAGPGDQALYHALADEYGVADLVELSHPLDEAALGEAMSRAHAMVIPSTTPEALPLVCIEAAFARLPVVASNIGGIPECLRDDEHALLFPPGDAEACAAALYATLTETEATAARVVRARRRADDFAYDRYLEESERFVLDAVAAFAGDLRAPAVREPV